MTLLFIAICALTMSCACFGNKMLSSCVDDRHSDSTNSMVYKYPSDAALHFEYVLRETSRYRGYAPRKVGSYGGPWIDNLFIDKFIRKPFSYFHGFIPLFVQWDDIYYHHIQKNTSISSYISIFQHLSKILRNDVLYLTVLHSKSQIMFSRRIFPNIIIISESGNGHIPIPLIRNEMKYVPHLNSFRFDIGYFGKKSGKMLTHSILRKIESMLKDKKVNINFNLTKYWPDTIAITAVTLAPRELVSQSHRTAEIIQIGRIPAYLYTDIPWVPYVGSDIDLYSIGFVFHFFNIEELVDRLSHIRKDVLPMKMNKIMLAREYYTYAGVINQMELFFKDPLGPNGGYLRCSRAFVQLQ